MEARITESGIDQARMGGCVGQLSSDLDFIKTGTPQPVTRLTVREAASMPFLQTFHLVPVAAAPSFAAGTPAAKPDKGS